MEEVGLRTKPYAHQLEAVDCSWKAEYYAYFMEQGTGKSWVTLEVAWRQWQEGMIDSLVVIAPKGTYRNWVKELMDHWPLDHNGVLDGVTIRYWSSYRVKRIVDGLNEYLDVPIDLGEFRVLLMNVEAFSANATGGDRLTQKAGSISAAEYLGEFLSRHRAMIAVDESTTIKHRKSKRSERIIRVRDRSVTRRILSGQPATNSPLDLWGQALFLKRGILEERTFTAFKQRYAIEATQYFGNRSFQSIVGYRDLYQLQAITARWSYRVLKSDCLDLPPKVYQTRDVDLSQEQRKVYNELATQFMSEAKAGLITTVVDGLTRAIRLHQVVCGHLVSDVDPVSGMRKVTDLDNNRVNELIEALEEIQGKVIIWASYRRDFEVLPRLLEKAGRKVVTYWGGTSEADREKAKVDFQTGEADTFLANPQVGGHGITLTAASAVIYYSNTHNLEHRLQSEDRAHRIGQTKSVTYIDLVARGTVDEKIMANLRAKRDLSGETMGDKVEWADWFKPVEQGD